MAVGVLAILMTLEDEEIANQLIWEGDDHQALTRLLQENNNHRADFTKRQLMSPKCLQNLQQGRSISKESQHSLLQGMGSQMIVYNLRTAGSNLKLIGKKLLPIMTTSSSQAVSQSKEDTEISGQTWMKLNSKNKVSSYSILIFKSPWTH